MDVSYLGNVYSTPLECLKGAVFDNSGISETVIPLWLIHNSRSLTISRQSPTDDRDTERRDRRAEMAKALARGGMEGVHVLSLEQAEEVLTPKRQELVEALGREQFASVRALARDVDRDKAQVSRDLAVLVEHAIVGFDTDGRSKRPRLTQEHVVIEPIV